MDELEVINKQINEQHERLTESLSNGSPKDYAEYKYTVGTIRGLRIAQEIINTLANRMEQDDE